MESLGFLALSPLMDLSLSRGSLLLTVKGQPGSGSAPPHTRADLCLMRSVEEWLSLSLNALTLSCQLCSQQEESTNLKEDRMFRATQSPVPKILNLHLLLCVFGSIRPYLYKDASLTMIGPILRISSSLPPSAMTVTKVSFRG